MRRSVSGLKAQSSILDPDFDTSLSDDHSELVPLLPIPNRTVKRLRADDSVDYPCESRSSSDSHKVKSPTLCWAFCFMDLNLDLLERSDKTLAKRACCGRGCQFKNCLGLHSAVWNF